MLASLFLLLAQAWQDGTAPREPRFSSLVLTEGIRGGFIPPIVRRRVELGYDWNAGDYRVTVYDPTRWDSAEGPYSTALLGRQAFEEILRGVRERGLETLPPQPDPDGADVYALDTGLEVRDGGLLWENLASGGCTTNPTSVRPTEEEQRAFRAVVTGILDAVAEVDLEPGCELDTGFLFRPADGQEARAFVNALQHVLQQPIASRVDRSRVDVLTSEDRYEFRFPWRALQDLEYAYSHMRRKESYDVVIERGTLAVRDVRCKPFEPSEETRAGRRAFLESRPDLPARLRRLVSTGWVASGMTAEMVKAAWGEPLSRDPLVYERHGQRVQLSFDREGLLSRRHALGTLSGLKR